MKALEVMSVRLTTGTAERASPVPLLHLCRRLREEVLVLESSTQDTNVSIPLGALSLEMINLMFLNGNNCQL